MITFDELMKGFGVVTAMDMCLYTPKKGYVGKKSCCSVNQGALTKNDFIHDDFTGFIDTMKITNINQEGPTKTITGGRFAAPLIKYGKTTTLEATDALGRVGTLVKFFGAEYDGLSLQAGVYTETNLGNGVDDSVIVFEGKIATAEEFAKASISAEVQESADHVTVQSVSWDSSTQGAKITLSAPPTDGDLYKIQTTVGKDLVKTGSRISFTETFPGPFAIEGHTEFVDKNGQKQRVYIFIPQFYPNGIFNLTQDTEGDSAVFDLGGTLIPTTIKDDQGTRTIIYEIRSDSFFCPKE